MACTDAFRLRWGFCFSIPQGGGPCSPLRVYFRRRSSATGGKESRSEHRGRAEVWTSQLASQPKQLVGEQGENRTQDRSRNPASREDSDDARSVRAGGRRGNTGGAGGISDGARSGYADGAVRCGLDCGLRFLGQHPVTYWKLMVGLGGLEPPTSPLSGARSSHLSYRPKSKNNYKILAGEQGLAQLQPLRPKLGAKKSTLYCTKPTFGAGVLPSGDSLIVPNCAS